MADAQTVLLGVTGSIAAYKAVELARLLIKRGVTVKTVMTEAAAEFVTPLTFRSITGNPVGIDMFEEPTEWKAAHVSLAAEADAIAIAPATADAIAKLAEGIADELLFSVVLASKAPLVVAPAMHTEMYENPATQHNLDLLRSRGAVVVEAESGQLASGDVGTGRLASPEKIVDAVMGELGRARDLAGHRVLVSAGGTQEPLDAVRYLGNRSSGKTGYAIARDCALRGAAVVLVSAPTAMRPPRDVELVAVRTAEEMAEATFERFDEADAVVMSAAVADFSPAEPSIGKIKKDAAPTLIALRRNVDILAELGKRKKKQVLIGFAAETDEIVANARGKLEAKNLDLVVANDVSRPGAGFDADDNEVVLVGPEADEALPRMSKVQLARHIVDRLVGLLEARGRPA
ncbi:MAG: bifunctional phosphopantothenoylcysteine decarboxylase/phosphopantothenate--cysteine ligase CoaBC [Actinobacteria bacterium]|nr:MAG: bifunctional phosphopantothenoylcysteine decarboxylase/phosphopantothenate--cysteine ligase CoaBC [Actinomycetota bacterium]